MQVKVDLVFLAELIALKPNWNSEIFYLIYNNFIIWLSIRWFPVDFSIASFFIIIIIVTTSLRVIGLVGKDKCSGDWIKSVTASIWFVGEGIERGLTKFDNSMVGVSA